MAKNVKVACRGCGKATGIVKYFIIADDLENPKPYHVCCIRKLMDQVLEKLSDTKAHFND